MSFHISCACGAVQAEVTGSPVMQVYCHCGDCRDWLGAPVHAATVWPKTNVHYTKGEDNLVTYARTDNSLRRSCKSCGSAVLVDHPAAGVVDVLASRLEGFKFEPAMHVFYAERMIDMADDLPKFVNLPKEAGGDGVLV